MGEISDIRTPEPVIKERRHPEEPLHDSVVAEVHRILKTAGCTYALVEHFGLDVGIFVRREQSSYSRFLELKAFVGSRPGGVGFGNQKGKGPQVDLLLHSHSELGIVDELVRWILINWQRPAGERRYAFFTCSRAKEVTMRGVKKGKQNNFRVNDFNDELMTWEQLCDEIRLFLLSGDQIRPHEGS